MKRPSRTQPVITYEAAETLVRAALGHAGAKGWKVAAVVVDPSGHVVASGRMDEVPAPVYDIACDKALTTTLGRSTLAFYERMASSTELTLGLSNRPRLCAWQGGLPILEGGTLIGGLGVSGATGPEDEECAAAALAAQGLGRAGAI